MASCPIYPGTMILQALHATVEGSNTPAQRQPGCLGWLNANFGIHVCVDRYALFMSSLAGLLLSLALLGIWIGMGSVMGYGEPNWWLIIGTYTGLVGLQDCRCHLRANKGWCCVLVDQVPYT